MRKIQLLALLVTGIGFSGCGPLLPPDQKAEIDYIERTISMPEGSAKLNQYHRTYAFTPNGVEARYERLSGNETSRISIVQPFQLSNVADGGCGFIDVTFDRKTEEITAFCHGDA